MYFDKQETRGEILFNSATAFFPFFLHLYLQENKAIGINFKQFLSIEWLDLTVNCIRHILSYNIYFSSALFS